MKSTPMLLPVFDMLTSPSQEKLLIHFKPLYNSKFSNHRKSRNLNPAGNRKILDEMLNMSVKVVFNHGDVNKV